MNKTAYKKIAHNNRKYYLGYVVAIRDPLNIHIEISLPREDHERYQNAKQYDYEFISEEYEGKIVTKRVYVCHLKNVEICYNPEDKNDAVKNSNMKDAYIYLLKTLKKTQNWVLVSVTDIDTYSRVLVNIFNVKTKESINLGMLSETSTVYKGQPITRQYSRSSKKPFRPKNKKPYYQVEK